MLFTTVLCWLKRGHGRGRRPRSARSPSFVPRLLVLEDRTLLSTITVMNNADSGDGDAGSNGGNGFGGGVYVAANTTVIVSASRITHNHARGGDGHDGGEDGLGMGGGVYNLGTFLSDTATVIRHNGASTSNDDCFGC